jgi:hypothetical protein
LFSGEAGAIVLGIFAAVANIFVQLLVLSSVENNKVFDHPTK